MIKRLLGLVTSVSLISVPLISINSYAESPYFSLKDGDGFKRFSVSVGALHVMPQGKAQPININTAVANGTKSKVGDVQVDSVLNAIDDSASDAGAKKSLLEAAVALDVLNAISYKEDEKTYLRANTSGEATINGLDNWQAQGTGLEADDVTTLGIMTNYFFSDNVSLEIKAGIPPKVDIQGKGQIYAPLTGVAEPTGIGAILSPLPLKDDIFITDLSGHGKVAEARAWTPAFEFQYHFGKTGVNKFRPYLGAGLMYAYFNELEINPNLERDLINAGHKIANIKSDAAGAALDGKLNTSADPKVKLEAKDVFAPVVTAGFTYDFNDRWFAVGSVSYAHLTGETTITVNDANLGELINAKSDIEINPILGYAGIGYRF